MHKLRLSISRIRTPFFEEDSRQWSQVGQLQCHENWRDIVFKLSTANEKRFVECAWGLVLVAFVVPASQPFCLALVSRCFWTVLIHPLLNKCIELLHYMPALQWYSWHKWWGPWRLCCFVVSLDMPAVLLPICKVMVSPTVPYVMHCVWWSMLTSSRNSSKACRVDVSIFDHAVSDHFP